MNQSLKEDTDRGLKKKQNSQIFLKPWNSNILKRWIKIRSGAGKDQIGWVAYGKSGYYAVILPHEPTPLYKRSSEMIILDLLEIADVPVPFEVMAVEKLLLLKSQLTVVQGPKQ